MSDRSNCGTRRDHILPGLPAIPAARRAVVAFTVDDDADEVLRSCHNVRRSGLDLTGAKPTLIWRCAVDLRD